ncbi:MAG: SprT-like domain-containing protein, partial [Flavobacteriaceae bacterium]
METILSFVPKEAKTQLKTLLEENGVPVIITKKRVTKHGDFRRKKNGEIAITINHTLNPYRFLITLIHELAHYQVYKTNGFNIKPHGEEWKNSFRML